MSRIAICNSGTALLLIAILGCGTPTADRPAAQAAPPWFEDITERSGLQFTHDAGKVGHYFLPEVIGSGAALFDFDNDGRLDILLLTNGGPDASSTNKLFHQEPDGTFRDVSNGSGLDFAGYNMGVAVGDVNNDGYADVLITQYGGLRLFLNNGNGTFSDVSAEAGIGSLLWGTSACFVDYDRDGWLDLVVTNYVKYDPIPPRPSETGQRDYYHPSAFVGSVTKVYRNLGLASGGRKPPGSHEPGGLPPPLARFEDVTAKAGLARSPGAGLGVVAADFDGDGWPDLFVAHDARPNQLWINQRDGTFKEEAVPRGVAYNGLGDPQGNMGIALGDADGDGLADLFVTHLTMEQHTLWRQGPRGLFRDRTAVAGLASPRWRGTGFGTAFADFDHDGALDLAVVNGRVNRGNLVAGAALGPYWNAYAERNQLFANDGTGHFRDLSDANVALCGTPAVARGLAVGDVDNDGALDLLVTYVAGPARLYRNIVPNRGHWLTIRALDPALKRDAYGAEIIVAAGGRRQTRWANPGYSYLCSNDPRAHFGLGPAEQVDAVEILWPDGTKELFPGGAADRHIVLRKGEGKPAGK